MVRFYADEDFLGPLVQILRTIGRYVLTIQEAGRRGSGDPQVLADATADKPRGSHLQSSPLQAPAFGTGTRGYRIMHAR